jgi:chemotaxis protein CheY-P-specific phosphatase CheC
MEFSEKTLQGVADKGSTKAAKAFSTIAKTDVDVSTSVVKTILFKDLIKTITPTKEHSIVVYAQAMTGDGVSILTMSREDALMLVDLLNQQAVGTTGILKDIDRSAIKETLNILSNSYVNALSEDANIELTVDVPAMIISNRLSSILETSLKDPKDKAVVFESTLSISQYELKTSLYLIFNKELGELIKNK